MSGQNYPRSVSELVEAAGARPDDALVQELAATLSTYKRLLKEASKTITLDARTWLLVEGANGHYEMRLEAVLPDPLNRVIALTHPVTHEQLRELAGLKLPD